MADNIPENTNETPPFSVIEGGRLGDEKQISPAKDMPWAKNEFAKSRKIKVQNYIGSKTPQQKNDLKNLLDTVDPENQPA